MTLRRGSSAVLSAVRGPTDAAIAGALDTRPAIVHSSTSSTVLLRGKGLQQVRCGGTARCSMCLTKEDFVSNVFEEFLPNKDHHLSSWV